MNIDKLLEKAGLTYEELTSAERDTLGTWMDSLQKSKISISSVKGYIASMRDAVEMELTKTDLNSKQDLLLKARLKNYMLLEAYLSTPEKAKEALNRAISGMIPRK